MSAAMRRPVVSALWGAAAAATSARLAGVAAPAARLRPAAAAAAVPAPPLLLPSQPSRTMYVKVRGKSASEVRACVRASLPRVSVSACREGWGRETGTVRRGAGRARMSRARA